MRHKDPGITVTVRRELVHQSQRERQKNGKRELTSKPVVSNAQKEKKRRERSRKCVSVTGRERFEG